MGGLVRFLLTILTCLLLVDHASADDSVPQDIIDYSEQLRESFRPSSVAFDHVNLKGKKSTTSYFELGDRFLFETPTAVCAANSRYGFFLERDDVSAPWQLKSLKPRTDASNGLELPKEVLYVKGATYIWMAANSYRIDEYLQVPDAVVKTKRSGSGDDEQVHLEIKLDSDKPVPSGLRATLVRVLATYFPNKYGWSPVETRGFWGDGGSAIRINRDFVEKDGFFVPTESEVQHYRPRAKEMHDRGVTEFVYTQDPPDEDRFMVSHYGFKEPVLPGDETSRVWVVIIAGVLLAACIFVFKWSRQKHA